MHVRGRAAYVHSHNVPDFVIGKLHGLHHRARGWHYVARHHVAYMFHARGLYDMLLKHLMDYLSRGFNVKLVKLRIHVFRNGAAYARFLENILHRALILHVAGVYYRRLNTACCYHSGVEKRGFLFAVIRSARKQYKVRLCFFKILYIIFAQLARRGHGNYRARAKRRGFGSLNGHIIHKAVYAHSQPARRAGRGKHFAVFYFIRAKVGFKVLYGAVQANAHVAFQHAGWRLPLADELRFAAPYAAKRIDKRCGGAYFCNKNVCFHVYLL